MFHSLLVPLDGSRFSEQSLPTAVALAAESGAALHLVHVHVPYLPDQLISNTQFQYEGVDLDEYDLKHRRSESAYLDSIAQGVADDLDGGLDTTVLDGPVPEAIHRFADECGTDLIVITSHGHSGVTRLWMGSVADALSRETNQPILVLRPTPGEDQVRTPTHFDHVLVGLDGSEWGESILEPVRDLGEMEARVTLVHIVPGSVVSGTSVLALGAHEIGEAMDRADEYLRSTARGLWSECETDVHVEQAPGPARGILRVAEELQVDLIALATHGYGGLKRALLGSVADKVLRGASVPVLLRKPT